MTYWPVLYAPLLLFAAGCGESETSVDESLTAGYVALNSSEYESALAHFETALDGIAPEHADYLAAKLAQLKALAFIDPKKTKTAFLSLPEGIGIEPADYRIIAGELGTAAGFHLNHGGEPVAEESLAAAVELLMAGSRVFPDHEGWEKLISTTTDNYSCFLIDFALYGCALGYAEGGY